MKRIAKQLINAQRWFDSSYPLAIRNQITKLSLQKRNLKGELVIKDFPKLKEINCYSNQLTQLTINNCPQLKIIDADWNELTKLTIQNCPEIYHLDVSDNSLNQDLTCLKNLVNLEELEIDHNHLYGSLEPLKNLSKLKKLDIRGTELDSGLEYLPESLERLWCFFTKLDDELSPYGEENEEAFKGWREVYKRDQQIKELKTKLETIKQENKELKQQLEKSRYQDQQQFQIQISPK